MGMTLEKIKEEMWKGSQSLHYRGFFNAGEKKIPLRITIKSDSYDNQSYARVHRYVNSKWEILYTIPYANMETESGLAYGPMAVKGNYQQSWFRDDIAELKDMSLTLLELEAYPES